MPLTRAERRKYLAELEKNKNLDGYVSSDLAGLKLRRLKRKELVAKSDVETGDVEVENLEVVGDGVASAPPDSPQPKKLRTGKSVDTRRPRPSASGGAKNIVVSGTSLNVQVTESFWHSQFDFRKYVFCLLI